MTDKHVPEQTRRKVGFFEDLVDFLTFSLKEQGIANPEKEAEEIALKMHENWRGQNLTFPQKPRLFFERLKDEVVSSYTGYNKTELIKKYNISETLFYKWLNERLNARIQKKEQGQLDL